MSSNKYGFTAPTQRDYFTLAFLAVVWGSSYLFIKRGLEVFTPIQIAALRLGIAGAILPFFAFRHLQRIKIKQLPTLFIVGLTGTALPSILFPLAQTHLSSSLTGMISGLTPIFTFIIAFTLARGQFVGWKQPAGVLLGLAGAILLAWAAPAEGGQTTKFAYVTFAALACLCYAISTNLVALRFHRLPSMTITVVSYLLVGIPAIIWVCTGSGILGILQSGSEHVYRSFVYVAALSIFSTLMASVIYYAMIQRTGSVFSSTVSYLIPVVALAWGVIDGEALGVWQLPAIAMILIGIFLSKRE